MSIQMAALLNAVVSLDFSAMQVLLPTIFVLLSILMNVLAFQFKNRPKIIACLIISCVCVTSHFYLLGVMTAAYLVALKVVTLLTAYFTSSKKVMGIFIALVLGITALTYENSLSLLSCAGEVMAAIGTFCRKDTQLRQLLFLSTLVWLTHNLFAGSEVVLKDILVISSNLVGYARFCRTAKHKLSASEKENTVTDAPLAVHVSKAETPFLYHPTMNY